MRRSEIRFVSLLTLDSSVYDLCLSNSLSYIYGVDNKYQVVAIDMTDFSVWDMEGCDGVKTLFGPTTKDQLLVLDLDSRLLLYDELTGSRVARVNESPILSSDEVLSAHNIDIEGTVWIAWYNQRSPQGSGKLAKLSPYGSVQVELTDCDPIESFAWYVDEKRRWHLVIFQKDNPKRVDFLYDKLRSRIIKGSARCIDNVVPSGRIVRAIKYGMKNVILSDEDSLMFFGEFGYGSKYHLGLEKALLACCWTPGEDSGLYACVGDEFGLIEGLRFYTKPSSSCRVAW